MSGVFGTQRRIRFSWADAQADDEDDDQADEKAAADVSEATGTSEAPSSADDIMAKRRKPTGKKLFTVGGVVA